jgi:hypothetical protein
MADSDIEQNAETSNTIATEITKSVIRKPPSYRGTIWLLPAARPVVLRYPKIKSLTAPSSNRL